MSQSGSDVAGTINKDHALAAQKTLDDNGYAKEWQVVVADDKMLMLDYDDLAATDCTLPEQFYMVLGILEQTLGYPTYQTIEKSKGGNTHAVIHLDTPLPIVERIAWQAAFGSDPKREALHLLSVSRGGIEPHSTVHA